MTWTKFPVGAMIQTKGGRSVGKIVMAIPSSSRPGQYVYLFSNGDDQNIKFSEEICLGQEKEYEDML
jgi:hypothetical protein